MADPSTLRGLLERVKSATEDEYELDRDIGFALDGWSHLPDDHELCRKYPECKWIDNGQGQIFADSPSALSEPSYTFSLDAALALVERVMPGAIIAITVFQEEGYTRASIGTGRRSGSGKAPTPALALLAALLEAQIMEAENDA